MKFIFGLQNPTPTNQKIYLNRRSAPTSGCATTNRIFWPSKLRPEECYFYSILQNKKISCTYVRKIQKNTYVCKKNNTAPTIAVIVPIANPHLCTRVTILVCEFQTTTLVFPLPINTINYKTPSVQNQ